MAAPQPSIPAYLPGVLPVAGQFVFEADGDTQQLPDEDIPNILKITAFAGNSSVIYVGDPTVTDTGGGRPLAAGESVTYCKNQFTNASQLFVSGKLDDGGCFGLS
jgi:hypothetical protein